MRVLSVSGDATIQAPGEPAPRALKVGETIVVGSRIVTGGASRVILTPLPGVKSIISPESDLVIERVASSTPAGSTVALQQATLDLRTGAITSDLQKSEGVALDYQIRTARGVAGARGTTYTVAIDLAGVQAIIVTHGNIAVTLADGRTLALAPGQVSLTRPDGATQSVTRLSDLSPADQAVAARWITATLEALVEAIEQGADIQDDALETATRTAEQLGLVLADTTREAIERARLILEQRRLANETTLQERLEERLGPSARRTDRDDDSRVVITERRPDPDNLPSDDFDYAAARALYFPFLDGYQRAYFDELSETRQKAILVFFFRLASDLRPEFVDAPYPVQDFIVDRATDTDLTRFALDGDGDGGFHNVQTVTFYAELSGARRTAFKALSFSQQSDLVYRDFPALENYVLAAGRTTAQVNFAFELSRFEFTNFLTLPADVQDILVAANQEAFTAFALAADDGGLIHTAAEIRYANTLSLARRSIFFDRPRDIQALLADHPSDADLIAFALDPFGEGEITSDVQVLFYHPLDASQRTVFRTLSSGLRDRLAAADDSRLTEFVLRTGVTQDQTTFLLDLSVNDSANFAAFFNLASVTQELLLANLSDTSLFAFAVETNDTGGLINSSTAVAYYAGLGADDRQRFALYFSPPLREAVATDSVLAGLAFAKDQTVYLNSVAVLQHYVDLPFATRPDFVARPADIREQFAAYAKPGLTAAVLNPATFSEGLAPTDSTLRSALGALLALDSQNQALFETFAGGPAYPKLATAPDPDSWSNGTFTRTGNSFASLNDAQRAQLLALGAAESIMDRSGTYLEAALADFNQLDTATRAALAETGWGRFFTRYFADETVRGLFAVAADLTSAERSTLQQFNFSPYALTDLNSYQESFAAVPEISATESTTPVLSTQRQNLATLSALPLADRTLLSSLDLGDELLSQRPRYVYDPLTERYVERTFGDILGTTLAFARSLDEGQLLALREMSAAGWLLQFTPDQPIIYNGDEIPILAREVVAGKIAEYLALSAPRKQAARDTHVFERISFYQGSINTQTDLIGFLDAWLALPAAAANYLRTESGNLSLYDVYLYGGGESQYRSLSDLGLILSGLSANELGTLRDLDIADALALNYVLAGDATLALGKLKTLLADVAALGDLERFTLRELGIVGDQTDRLGILFVDPDNLARLLGEYSQLDKAIRVDTRQIDPQNGYRTYTGNNFFFAADRGGDFTTYDVVFNATDDLRVGATRRLALSQYSSSTTTFNVPAGKSVHLRASDVIDLNSSSFSEGVNVVTMVSGTIVLTNVNFPEGSRVALTSKDGGLYFGYDTVMGGVNFRDNVRYGQNLMFDNASFHEASRGNINIGSFANPAQIPTSYTPPPQLVNTGNLK